MLATAALLALVAAAAPDAEASADPWKAGIDAIHALGDEEWFEKIEVEERRPEDAPRHERVLRGFADVRRFSVRLTYVEGHPQAKGAISTGGDYLLRKGDAHPYKRGDPTDLVTFARKQRLAFPDHDALHAYLDFHHFFFAGGGLTPHEDGGWRVTSPFSGRPLEAVWRVTLDDEHRLEKVEYEGTVPRKFDRDG